MPLKKWFMLVMILLAGAIWVVPVYAEEENPELPVIALWQEGHGYQEDGTQIVGGWAYDSVNTAGKYVLFGEDGTVIRKAERQDTAEIMEDYTGTELVPAVIALRAEVFEGFQGTVQILLEEKSGAQKKAELNDGNFYSLNICVNSGDYVLREVEARDTAASYVTEFTSDAVHIPEKAVRVMKVYVTDAKIEQQEDSPEDKQEAVNTQTESNIKQQVEYEDGKEESGMQETGMKKVIMLFGSIGAACLAGILLLRKKQKKYS